MDFVLLWYCLAMLLVWCWHGFGVGCGNCIVSPYTKPMDLEMALLEGGFIIVGGFKIIPGHYCLAAGFRKQIATKRIDFGLKICSSLVGGGVYKYGGVY